MPSLLAANHLRAVQLFYTLIQKCSIKYQVVMMPDDFGSISLRRLGSFTIKAWREVACNYQMSKRMYHKTFLN